MLILFSFGLYLVHGIWTPCDAARDRWAHYLDRHSAACPSNQYMTGFLFTERGCSGSDMHYKFECTDALGSAGGIVTKKTSCEPFKNRGIHYLDRHALDCRGHPIKQFKVEGCAPDRRRYSYQCYTGGNYPIEGTYYTPCEPAKDRQLRYLDRHNVQCPAGGVLSYVKMVGCEPDKRRYEYKCVFKQCATPPGGDTDDWVAKARAYAPIVKLHVNERYFPSSVEWYFNQMVRQKRDHKYWLMKKSGATFGGQNPSQQAVPAYALVVPKDGDTVDISYWMFYPFNYGKNVCIGVEIDGHCIGGRKAYGHHYGDWEHVTIRFEKGLPTKTYAGAHSGNTGREVEHYPTCTAQRQEFYAADGSHGMWRTAGTHKYEEILGGVTGEELVDVTTDGVRWDLQPHLQVYHTSVQLPTWLQGGPGYSSSAVQTTSCTSAVNQWAHYLDRHSAACPPNQYMSSFRFTKSGCSGLDMHYKFECTGTLGSAGGIVTKKTSCEPFKNRGIHYLDRHSIDCGERPIKQVKVEGCAPDRRRYSYQCYTSGNFDQVTYYTPCDWAKNERLQMLEPHNLACPVGGVLSYFKMVGCATDKRRYQYKCSFRKGTAHGYGVDSMNGLPASNPRAGPIFKWGNPETGCDVFYCNYGDGPTGPEQKKAVTGNEF